MKIIPRHITFLIIALSLFALPFLMASCGDKEKSAVTIDYDSGSVPSLATDSVTMLISDSGIVRYKVIAKVWNQYDQVKDKYAYFPEGLYGEQFDSLFHVIASVKADTAWNFVNKKLWKLKKNVFIKNHETGDTFESEEFYWDEQKRTIYSDSIVKINQPGQNTVYASKFVSNQEMTDVRFIRVGPHGGGRTVITVNEKDEQDEENEEEKTE